MIDLTAHLYLQTTLLLAAAAALVVLLMPGQRRQLLLSGLLAVPLACFAYQHSPWYWETQRTGNVVPALEDFLFMGCWGVLAWAFATLPMVKRPQGNLRWQPVAWLYVPGLLAGLGTTEFLRQVVFGPFAVMFIHIALFALFAGFCLLRRPDLWPLALSGAVLSGVFGTGFLLVFTAWQPAYLQTYNPAAQLPWKIGTLPAFEAAWPTAFGGCWPLFLAYACQMRIGPAPARPTAARDLRAAPASNCEGNGVS